MHANLCRMVNSSKLVFLDAIKSIHIETLFAERMKQMENMFYELNRAADVNAQLWMKN